MTDPGQRAETWKPVEQPLTDSTGAAIMHVFHASSSVGASLKG